MTAPTLQQFRAASVQPSPADYRDIVFRTNLTPADIVKYKDNSQNILSVPDQLEIGSCVGNGLTTDLESFWFKHDPRNAKELSRLFAYTATKNYENRLEEEGVYTRNAYRIARHYGVPLESQYPYDTSLHTQNPPAEIYALADQNRLERYEAVVRPRVTDGSTDDKIHRICAAVQEGFNVGFSMMVTDSLRYLSGPKEFHDYKLLGQGSPDIGGHYMLIVGFDFEARKFIVVNSWGTDWGDGGFCMLPFAIVDELFFEAWIVRRFKGFEITEEPGWKFEFKNNFRLNARYVPTEAEKGTTKNLWIGGIFQDQPYIRSSRYRTGEIMPLSELDGNVYDYGGNADNWVPYDPANLPEPTFRDVSMDEDVYCRLVQWMDMRGFTGGAIYCGLSDSDDFTTAEIAKIVVL